MIRLTGGELSLLQHGICPGCGCVETMRGYGPAFRCTVCEEAVRVQSSPGGFLVSGTRARRWPSVWTLLAGGLAGWAIVAGMLVALWR